jgi:hypothetical protein
VAWRLEWRRDCEGGLPLYVGQSDLDAINSLALEQADGID